MTHPKSLKTQTSSANSKQLTISGPKGWSRGSRERRDGQLSIVLIFRLWLTDRADSKERTWVYQPVLLLPATLFSRSSLLKRTILSSLPVALAFHSNHKMAPVTGRNEKSSKMHSRVVGSPSHLIRVSVLDHLFPRSSSALDLQDTPPPSTWPGPISSLSSSRVSWPTGLPLVVN